MAKYCYFKVQTEKMDRIVKEYEFFSNKARGIENTLVGWFFKKIKENIDMQYRDKTYRELINDKTLNKS